MKISEQDIMVLWGHIEFWIANQKIACSIKFRDIYNVSPDSENARFDEPYF